MTKEQQLQILEQIDKVDMSFAKVQFESHPSFTDFDRYILIYGFNSNLRTKTTTLLYDQIGVNKSGQAFVLPLKTPEFKINAESWSYLRDANNEIQVDENGNQITVDSHKYFKFLISTNQASLLQLITLYTYQFIQLNADELNQPIVTI